MVMTQANTLKRNKIQEAMFAILGQDYKSGHGTPNSRWSLRPSGKGRGYCADDETVESVADDWADWDEDDYGYYEYDENDTDWQDYEFDYDAAYYGDDAGNNDPVLDYEFDVAEYDSCYASYLKCPEEIQRLENGPWISPCGRLGPFSLLYEYVTNSDTYAVQHEGQGQERKSKRKGQEQLQATQATYENS